MTAEESVDKADLIANEHPKTETEKTRTNEEGPVEPGEFVPRKGKGEGQSRGDQHHPGDGSHPENEQIDDRPSRLANRTQDE